MYFVVLQTIIFGICYIICRKMVSNRSFLAKSISDEIGQESPETIEAMIKVAKEVISTNQILILPEHYEISVVMFEGKIWQVKVATKKTKITIAEDGSQKITQEAFTEVTASIFMAFLLWACSVLIQIGVFVLYLYGTTHGWW